MLKLLKSLDDYKIILSIVLFVIVLLTSIWYDEKYTYPINKVQKVILFDIDGTLTDQPEYENEQIIEFCLVNDIAVGVCTAGGVYQPNNIDRFDWCPKNLYKYMKDTDFVTFNNVGEGGQLLLGKPAAKLYSNAMSQIPPNTNPYGWMKGFVMFKTLEHFNIKNNKNVILLDNDKHYLNGVKKFNNSYNRICVNKTCKKLDINLIQRLLK
jgi:hypothetical protein